MKNSNLKYFVNSFNIRFPRFVCLVPHEPRPQMKQALNELKSAVQYQPKDTSWV